MGRIWAMGRIFKWAEFSNGQNFGSPYKPVVVLQINDLCDLLRVDFATEKHGKTQKYSVPWSVIPWLLIIPQFALFEYLHWFVGTTP